MGTSKILIDGVGIDLTQDTVAANKMLSGIKAHDSNGNSVTGSIQTWAGTQKSGVKSITENGTYDVTEFASASVSVPQNIEKIIFTNIDPSIRKLHIPVNNASRFQHAIILPSTRVSSELTGNTTYGTYEMFGVYYTVATNVNVSLTLTQHDGVEILANEVTFQSAFTSRYWGLIDYIVLLW